MSQRSHIAQSGSSAIIECSAACSADRSLGILSRPASCSPVGTYQIASVSKLVSGRSSGTVSRVAWSRTDFFWYATTRSVTDSRPNVSSSPQRCSARSGSSIVVAVSFFASV